MQPFIRQDGEPLFPKILYNRPVTRSGAGRLLVVGGHSGEFSHPTMIHQLATAAGIGECRAALPDSLLRLLGGAPATTFVPSSTSGSLGRDALGRLLELSEDVDAVALGASLSANSNTTMLVERLVGELQRPLILFDDALRAIGTAAAAATNNPDVLIIATMAEVFKLAGYLGVPINIRPGAGLVNKLEIIQDLKAASACSYVIYGTEIIIAAGDQIIVTPTDYKLSLIPALFEAVLSVFWLQNPTDRRAGLATGAYVIQAAGLQLNPSGHPGTTTGQPTLAALTTAINQVLRHNDF